MNDSIFNYKSYKKYLSALVGPKTQRSGLRSKFSRILSCQTTYISQVIYGSAHFSLEQANKISDFLRHSAGEKEFFFTLILKERTSDKMLGVFFEDKLKKQIEQRLILTKRMDQQEKLSKEMESIYYSSWQFAAVHIALTVPALRTIHSLSTNFGITNTRVSAILDFLCQAGLAKFENGQYFPLKSHIRLGRDSHNIIKHHTHWRLQAVESLERESLLDMHYSSVVSLGADDIIKIKEMFIECIENFTFVVKSSDDEKIYCLNVDFFNLEKKD